MFRFSPAGGFPFPLYVPSAISFRIGFIWRYQTFYQYKEKAKGSRLLVGDCAQADAAEGFVLSHLPPYEHYNVVFEARGLLVA